jgi:ribosomal protein S18 acetylase RimI-like enzyme
METAIQRYLRTSAARGREVERVGPFLATFDRGTDHPYLSYAIPDDGARPSAADVATLREAYARRSRVPRLEFLPAAAPEAEPALRAGGFAVEARPPLMTCAPSDAVALPAPDGVELVLPRSDAELRAGGAVADVAFGDDTGSPEEQIRRARELLAAGGIAVLARDAASGEAVGWGVCTPPRDGVTELGGIAVAATHRRRGIAGAVTARLAAAAFDRGVETAFLTPGDAGAERVYARAGFAARAEMLHMRA